MAVNIQSSETTIDHVGLVGHDMTAMSEAYRRLGFTVGEPSPLTQPSPDGSPVPLGHISAHIVFAESYVELTAVQQPGQGNPLDTWLAKHQGLHVMALRATNAEASWAALTAHGLVMPPVRASSRDITVDGVTAIADFKWFQLPDSIAKEGFACVVEHQTPELIFVPRLTDHANGATGLLGISVLVDNLEEAVARYRRLPGANVKPFPFGRYIMLKNQRFIVLTAKGFSAVCPGAKLPSTPCFAGLAVYVKDIAATRDYMTANGVTFQITDDRSIWIKPEFGCGAIVMFVEPTP